MKLSVLRRGWHRHLKHFRRLRRRLAGGQDPKVFCLSCSDSRVSVHEIFDLERPGSIFEVKNVGGLFTEDAKAALVYALRHLNPNFIVLLHHTSCGGYGSLQSEDTEPEIRRHMVDGNAGQARFKVEAQLADLKVKLPGEYVKKLVVEEGLRIQAESLKNFLILHYPRLYDRIKAGEVQSLALMYDIVSGRIYRVPDSLEECEDTTREEL
jgi:carbonic anhydrase